MEGLYLYCIREKTKDSPAISTKGIDGRGEAYTLLLRGLEAIVSKVSLEEFASEEIQRKAQEDLNWIKEKALTHARVIQEAMTKDGVGLSLIPMKFGTILRDKARLEELLEENYPKIREVLERVRGKQEWSFKVYLRDRKALEEKTKEKNELIKEREREIGSLPEGMAYFMEEELKEFISKEVNKELDNVVTCLDEILKKQAVDSVRCRIFGKEFTGRIDPMILNAAYLLPDEKIEHFKKEVEALNGEMQALGLYVEYSGPWPAYNFTSW